MHNEPTGAPLPEADPVPRDPADFYRAQPSPRRDSRGNFVVDWPALQRLARTWDASGIFPEEGYREYCRQVGNQPTDPSPYGRRAR